MRIIDRALVYDRLLLLRFASFPMANMTCSYRSLLSVAFCSAFLTLCSFNVHAGERVSANMASQVGLEQAWQRQLQVPAGAGSIVDQQIHVHQSDPHEYVEIIATLKRKNVETGKEETYESVMERIAINQVDRNGKTIGKKEAERLAKNQIRRLEYRGIEAKLGSRTVPRINLYTLGNDGTLECRDAETGAPVWVNRFGDQRLGYSKLGIDDEYVTVINGGNLIELLAKDGTEVDSIRTTSMPLFGAIHTGGYSMVPTINNGIVGYPLKDITDVPFAETVQGQALAPPSKSPTSSMLAWGTDRSLVYVMECEGRPSVLFRLNTDGIVSGRIAAAAGDKFYFGSESGQVYCVHATREGEVVWGRPYGEPFYNEPLVVGNQLLLRSTYGNLYSLDTASGMMTWTYTVPNVDELLGAFDGKIFVRLLSGGLSVIDLNSGKTINSTNEVQLARLLTNFQTNRLYLVGTTGSVQCLRPIGEDLPSFDETQKSTSTPNSTDPNAEKQMAASAAADATAKDPFGAMPDADTTTDPFGAGGTDPFSGGGDDAMADPFGGGDDPFAN